jgi:hypothetical protein
MSNNHRHAAKNDASAPNPGNVLNQQKVVVLSTPVSPGRKKGPVKPPDASKARRLDKGDKEAGEAMDRDVRVEKRSSAESGVPAKKERSATRHSAAAAAQADISGDRSKRRDSDKGKESKLEAPKSPRNNHSSRPRRKSSPGPSHREASSGQPDDSEDRRRPRSQSRRRRSGDRKSTSGAEEDEQEDEQMNLHNSRSSSRALRKSSSNVASANPPAPASPKGRSRQQPKEVKNPAPPRSPGSQHRKSSRSGGGAHSVSPTRQRRTRSQKHIGGGDGDEHDAPPPEHQRAGSAPLPPPPLSPTPAQQPKAHRRGRDGARKSQDGPTAPPSAAGVVSPRPPPPPPLPVPAMAMASSNVDMVDIVALEPPDYEEFYSSPRRRKSAAAGAAAEPPDNGPDQPARTSRAEAGAGGAAEKQTPGAAQSRPNPPKAKAGAATTAPVPGQSKVATPTAARTYPAAATAARQAEPATPKAANLAATSAAARVASTRSRLQGVMGSMQWVIHIDTPGGHAQGRLQLVRAVEVWDDDDDEGDEYGQRYGGAAQDDRLANPKPVQAAGTAPPSAAWCENSIQPTGDDRYDDDDSSLDTQKLHESVLHFVKKLETTRPGLTAEEGFDDSIIDYAHSSHQRPVSPAPDAVQQVSQGPHKESTHSQQSKQAQSAHSSSHKGTASDRRPSQPQRHVSHASMWSSNRLVQPQVQAPPPPPPPPPPLPPKPTSQPKVESNGSLPSDSVTTSSSSRLLSQYEQQHKQEQGPVQAHQLVLTPSDHFVPRVMNIQGMVLLNETAYRVERENSKDSRTFADTLGDDTIENSCDMPDMWQIDEFEKSQTWGHSNDFSASDVGDDDEETLDNPFSPGGKSVDTNVVDDYDEEDDDDDVSEYQKNRAAGYLTNYGYAGTPGSAMVMKGSVSRGSNAQSVDDGSIDPSKGFLPRGSKASTLTDATDSLADIQDSFACDSGVEDFQHSQLTEKRRNQIGTGAAPDAAYHASNNQSIYSQSLSSLPEDRVLDEGHVASGHGAYSNNVSGGMRRTIGILGGGALPGVKRSPESQLQSQSLLVGRRDAASRMSATQHQPAQRPMAMRQRVHAAAKQCPSPSTSSNSDSSVPKLASQFADSFLGPANCPSSALKNAGFTTCSENDAHALQHGVRLVHVHAELRHPWIEGIPLGRRESLRPVQHCLRGWRQGHSQRRRGVQRPGPPLPFEKTTDDEERDRRSDDGQERARPVD